MKRTKQKNMRRILPVFFVQLLLVVAAYAQAKRPMTPEDVVSLNRASDARMSPDARRLAFLSERGSDAEAGAQIFLLNPMGGEPVQLTSHKAPIQSFEWSPDGRLIAFIAEEARERSRTKPPVVVDEDHRFAQLWVVDVASGEIKPLTKGSRHVTAFNWSFDGSRIVLTARATPKMMDNDTTEIFVTPASLQNAPYSFAQWKQITKGGGAENQPRFSPDGRWISYLARADGDVNVGPERIHVVAATGGESRALAQTSDGYISSYRWVFDSQRVIFLAAMGVSANLYTMRVDDPNPAPTLMTRNEGVTTGFSMNADGSGAAQRPQHDPDSADAVEPAGRIVDAWTGRARQMEVIRRD